MTTKTRFHYLLITLALLAGICRAGAQGNTFTYQGRLNTNGNPANGFYDFQFTLSNAPAGGSQLGTTITQTDMGVTNGLFTTTLNFGAVFTGETAYLGISVRSNGVGTYTPITPPQELNPSPYAIFAETASNISGTLLSADLSGTYPNAVTLNNAGNSFTGAGGGLTGLNATQLTSGTVPDARLSTNVALLDTNQTFTGSNIFSGSNPSFIVKDGGPINTNLFTGLAFQYYDNSGEGAIMSSFNDGNAHLTFYTKQGTGYPVAEQMKIDRYGVVFLDQQNANSGVLNNGATNGAGLAFGVNSGEGIASQRTAGVNQDGLDFYTGNTRQMSILHNGNIGMGTTNPATALQVIGTVNATAFVGDGSGLTNLSLLSDPGTENFFAGQSAGNSTLTGIENTGLGFGALFVDTSGSYNTAVGVGSLSANKAGSFNTAEGAGALFANVIGSNNTAFGFDALLSNSNGNNNTAIGIDALFDNTNGNQNTGVGAGALFFNTSGGNNTAVGYQALLVNTNQSQNTALGSQALLANTGGSQNTGAGYRALFGNTSGSQNTASGAFALNANTSGGNNVADGYQALYNNSVGFNNVADGYQALYYNTNGSANTATGLQALFLNTSGGENTADGFLALFANTSGGNNVADGYEALEDNTIGIQNTAIGSGALTASSLGSYNTAAGTSALGSSTDDQDNSAFGVSALGLNNGGSYNTAMGSISLAINEGASYNTACGFAALLENTTAGDNTAIGAYAVGGGGGFTTGGGNTATGGYSIYDLTAGYNNTAAGFQALYGNTGGVDNIGIGVSTLYNNSTGGANTAIGTYSFQNMTAGDGNVGLGYYAGNSLKTGSNNIYIGNAGLSSESDITRIGSGQTETYIAGSIQLDGADTNNGVTYVTSAPGPNPLFPGQGPFLFGYNGGALGGLFPTTIAMSWDYSGDIWVSNNCSVGTLTIRGGSDLAEPFDVSSKTGEIPEGSVVVIDEENPGRLKVSSRPYDTCVAGVLSGANGIHPGIQMQQQGLLEGGKNVALTGRVYVQADASYGSIRPGDLLTTSATPGHAMKVKNHQKAQGAILGKAMSGLRDGKGMVLVLVTLQ